MAQLSLALLGTFRARLDGQAIGEFESDKARALLTYLVVEVDQPHPRDHLAGLLWPDWPNTNARANLRHALNNLRTVLRNQETNPPFLLSERQTIQFNPASDYFLDVEEFGRHLVELAKVEPGQAGEPIVQGWQRATKLYAGPFLHGFFLPDCSAFEEWLLLTRERLQLQMLATLRALALHFEQQGDYKEAQRYVRRQLELDPLREEAHGQLMRLLALTGQRSAALVQFETCRKLLADELSVGPDAELVALQQQIQTGQLRPLPPAATPIPPRLATPRHNLPAPTTSLIGRQAESSALCQKLLSPEVRWLTLTGPGGTGKTRLALQVATKLVEQFGDGVFLVPLAPIQSPELVGPTIAEVLGVRETGDGHVLELLKEFVQDKHLLLVLDNFEHLIPAAPVVTDLLTTAPRLKTMVTSRTLLRMYGEYNYPVPPLSVPDLHEMPLPEQLLEYESCQLFVERARAIKPDFVVTSDNARAIIEICARLDGLPLAIELAAAWIGVLPPQKMLAQLGSRLQFLTRGARNLPDRQQTLRRTIDWSYELLDPTEQVLFGRLAVFADSWTIEAAGAVGTITGPVDVLNELEAFVDKSLVKQFEHAGEPRFMMLETIREYARERLSHSGEASLIQHMHASYYLRLAEAMAPALRAKDQETWLEELEIEHDNLRAALRWARDNRDVETGLRLVGVLWRFWETRGHVTEGRQYLEEVLSHSQGAAPALRAEAHTGAGTMAWHQRDYRQAIAHHQAALSLYQGLGDQSGVAFALNNLGVQAMDQGDHERAAEFLEQSLRLAQALGAKAIMLYPRHNLGTMAKRQKNYERAAILYEENLVLCRELGDPWLTAITLGDLGVVSRNLGDYERARRYFKESLILSRRIDDKEHFAEWLEGYAGLAAVQARPERAARLWGAAEALRETIGVPLALDEQGEYERNVAMTRNVLGEVAFASAWTMGRSMPLERVVIYALEES